MPPVAAVDPLMIDMIITDLCSHSGPGRTICPTQAARALCQHQAIDGPPPGPDDWHAFLPLIRRRAVALAREGRLVIYRKGKPISPDDMRGVCRLGSALQD
jgi:hypothetical protein